MTAYRVATLSGVPRTKINAEIRRLETAGFVRSRPLEKGRSGWELVDPDIRRLLRKRIRIVWSEDLLADAPRLAAETRKARAASGRPIDARLLGDPRRVRNPDEFARPLEKDRVLLRLGLRPSSHSEGRGR
jgi:sugar-specific transcriptional regulator TrmB